MLYYLKGMCCIVASLSLHTGLFAKTKPVKLGFCYCFFFVLAVPQKAWRFLGDLYKSKKHPSDWLGS
jgi:hypothetical protein